MKIFSQVKDSLSSALRAPLVYHEGLQRAQQAYFQVAPTRSEVVAYRGRARLLCYRSTLEPSATSRTPLLLIPSLIGRYYLFDLLSRKSFVSFFAQQGFDLFVIDWGTPSPADRDISLAQHIEEYVSYFVTEALRGRFFGSATPGIHLMGYSLGGVMAASFASIQPKKISSLTLLSTPIDLSLSGNVGRSIRAGRRAIDAMLRVFGEMPSWAIQGGFHWLTPASFWGDAARIMLSGDNTSKEELAALQRWLHDAVPIPKATYHEIVHKIYLENALIQDQFVVGGRAVRLQDIQSPTLLVTADDDHICPAISSLALRGKTSGPVETLMIPGAHTAAALGAADILWPHLADWFRGQDER
jgi:polyhydroxyalkanoate synthase